MKPRILLIASRFFPELGSFRICSEISRGLAAKGFKITVLTSSAPSGDIHQVCRSQIISIERGLRIDIIRVRMPRSRTELAPALEHVFSPIFFSVALPAIVGKFDLVLVFSPPLVLYFWATILSKLYNKPVISYVNDIHPRALAEIGLIKNKLEIQVLSMIERLAYKLSNLIVLHSEGAREVIVREAGERKCAVVPLWANTEELKQGPKMNRFRKMIGPNKLIVTFAGLMSYSQDLVTVIEAASLLNNDKSISFVMAGKGPQRNDLIRTAGKRKLSNVLFLPFLETKDYNDLCSASDLMLVPLKSTVETSVIPSKILDIMAVGRPIILMVPENNDAKKLISKAKCGIWILPERPKTLAQTILKLKNSSQLLVEMGQNGSVAARTTYSLNSAIGKIENLVLDTLSNESKSSILH
jgi:glycosyltransferase involved in cell wall biosynthesis